MFMSHWICGGSWADAKSSHLILVIRAWDWRTMRLSICRIVLCASVLAVVSFAQSAPSQPAFEVESIKPSGPKGCCTGVLTYPGGRIKVVYATLELMIQYAFDVQAFQIAGGPGWMRDDRYEVEAKPPASSKSSLANPASPKSPMNEEQREMLRTLLVERFNLRFHREIRQGLVYVLLTGKSPLKLVPAKSEADAPWVGSPHGGMIVGDGIAGTNISMPTLAARLGRYLGRPVLDETAMAGSFNFKYEYAAGESAPDVISSILTSVQALGLKLESRKDSVETIVVDRAERPSPN